MERLYVAAAWLTVNKQRRYCGISVWIGSPRSQPENLIRALWHPPPPHEHVSGVAVERAIGMFPCFWFLSKIYESSPKISKCESGAYVKCNLVTGWRGVCYVTRLCGSKQMVGGKHTRRHNEERSSGVAFHRASCNCSCTSASVCHVACSPFEFGMSVSIKHFAD